MHFIWFGDFLTTLVILVLSINIIQLITVMVSGLIYWCSHIHRVPIET